MKVGKGRWSCMVSGKDTAKGYDALRFGEARRWQVVQFKEVI